MYSINSQHTIMYDFDQGWIPNSLCQACFIYCFFNKHIIFIGHEDNGQMDDLGNLIKQTVMIGGSSNTTVQILLSEIWYMSYTNGKRKIHFSPFGVKTPIKTRMIDNEKCRSIEWNYSLENGGDGIKEWFEKWKNSTNKIVL